MSTLRWAAMVLVVVAAAVGLGLGAVALAPVPHRPAFPPALRAAGLLVAACGVALAGWTFVHHPPRLMARVTARTVEIGLGRLDPASSAVPRLITTGPYRWVRNPIYLAVLLLVEGIGLAVPLAGLLLAGAVLLAWWSLVVIPPEERELAARFGAEYGRYRASTRRFAPRLGRRGPPDS